ncbi:MAG: radical SAM protein [Desulfovibrio sp.]|nr:radical SAM protein [Desulfovibrio sp.]MBI4960836.1 radical SAM protein [Desulfovibrio sp.]
MTHRFESIILELTNVCNFKCPFCPSEAITREKGHMSLDIFAKIVREIKSAGLTETIQFGLMGEPFMNKRVFEFAELASESGLTVRCFTNGSLLTSKNIASFAASKIDELYISYRGVDAQAFSSISTMDYERYISGIRELLTLAGTFDKKKVIIKCFKPSLVDAVVKTSGMAKNVKADQSAEYVNLLLKSIGMKQTVRSSKTAFHNTIDLGNNIVVRLESIARWNDTPDNAGGKGFVRGVVGACDGMRGHIGILYNGDVTTCCKDYDGNNVLGNVAGSSILEILESPQAIRFKDLMRWCVLPTPYCRICRGGENLMSSLVNQLGSIAYFRTPFFREKTPQ